MKFYKSGMVFSSPLVTLLQFDIPVNYHANVQSQTVNVIFRIVSYVYWTVHHLDR